MTRYLLCIILLSNFAHGQVYLKDTNQVLQISYMDTCYQMHKEASLKTIPGSQNFRPLFFANGIIISGSEINETLLDTIYILKCPESFEKFGNLGALGIVQVNTKQKFEIVTIPSLRKVKKAIAENPKVTFAVNGYLYTDTTLRFSRRAIQKIDIIKNENLKDFNNNTACISIWTVTKREIRKDNQLPKLCRGIPNHSQVVQQP